MCLERLPRGIVHDHRLDVCRVGPCPGPVGDVVEHDPLRPQLTGHHDAVPGAVRLVRRVANCKFLLLEVNIRSSREEDIMLPGPVLSVTWRSSAWILEPEELTDGVSAEQRDSKSGSEGVYESIIVNVLPDHPVVRPVMILPGSDIDPLSGSLFAV